MKRLLPALAVLLLTPPGLVAQDKMTVLLDWFVNPDHGPIIIAQEQGYFADEGLEIEIVSPADPSDLPRWSRRGAPTSPSAMVITGTTRASVGI